MPNQSNETRAFGTLTDIARDAGANQANLAHLMEQAITRLPSTTAEENTPIEPWSVMWAPTTIREIRLDDPDGTHNTRRYVRVNNNGQLQLRNGLNAEAPYVEGNATREFQGLASRYSAEPAVTDNFFGLYEPESKTEVPLNVDREVPIYGHSYEEVKLILNKFIKEKGYVFLTCTKMNGGYKFKYHKGPTKISMEVPA